MRILQLTNAYPTEKLPVFGIFIKEQIDSLNDIGITADLYFINGREKGKLEYYKAAKELKKIIDNYDIIHVHHFLSALVVLWLHPKAKVIVTFLSDGIKEFIRPDNLLFNTIVKKNLYNYILKHSDARIFKKAVPSFLVNDPYSFYLPNGVNTELFSPLDRKIAKSKLGLDSDKTYILFASLLDINRHEKRYDIYKKTIRILKQKYGRDDIEELRIVNVSRSEVPLYFSAASVHLLTSDFEGSPNSVKESLACNTPVVSTDVGNVAELVNGLKSSFISQTNNPEELAALVDRVLNIDIFENSRQTIIDRKYDIKSKALELKNIYNKVLNK